MQKNISFMDIVSSYIPYVKGCANHFPEHHREDLCQEGLLGLFCACQTYDESSNVPFDAYAKICIRNRMLTAFRSFCRNDKTEELTEETTEAFADDGADASMTRVFFEELRQSLSDLEKTVLDSYLADQPYSDITKKTGLSEKQIDNALSRIKHKIRLLY